jgi:hypothetical protein
LFYAQATNGAVWTGPYTTKVPYTAFHLCWDYNGFEPGKWIGMRLLDVGSNYHYTVNLVS